MIGKVLIWLITTGLLPTAVSTAEQQTEKIFRIGYLDTSIASGSTAKQKKVTAIMTMASRPFFAEKKADRRACWQIPVVCDLFSEGVYR